MNTSDTIDIDEWNHAETAFPQFLYGYLVSMLFMDFH